MTFVDCRRSLTLVVGRLPQGWIKTWDVRMDECITELSRLNDSAHHAISHVHASPPADDGRGGDEDGRFLAANSYDNILRVYDRRSQLISSGAQDPMQLSFLVTGHKNKNWPIKSAFFRGDGHKYKLHLPSRAWPRKLTDGDAEDFADADAHGDTTAASAAMPRETLLLATGSADNKIYLHDVSLSGASGKPAPFLAQRLDGHTDRVYCVDFHPTEPILASASADLSVKIWLPRAPARVSKPKN
jgi:COMPASS component SWD3